MKNDFNYCDPRFVPPYHVEAKPQYDDIYRPAPPNPLPPMYPNHGDKYNNKFDKNNRYPQRDTYREPYYPEEFHQERCNSLDKPFKLPVNRPIDMRISIPKLEMIDLITYPYLGLIFYAEDTNKYYKVTKLMNGYKDPRSGFVGKDGSRGGKILTGYFIGEFEPLPFEESSILDAKWKNGKYESLVKNAIGNLAEGTDISNFSIEDILASILGLDEKDIQEDNIPSYPPYHVPTDDPISIVAREIPAGISITYEDAKDGSVVFVKNGSIVSSGTKLTITTSKSEYQLDRVVINGIEMLVDENECKFILGFKWPMINSKISLKPTDDTTDSSSKD